MSMTDWTVIRDNLAEKIAPILLHHQLTLRTDHIAEACRTIGVDNSDQLLAHRVYAVVDALLAERRKIFIKAVDEAAGL